MLKWNPQVCFEGQQRFWVINLTMPSVVLAVTLIPVVVTIYFAAQCVCRGSARGEIGMRPNSVCQRRGGRLAGSRPDPFQVGCADR